MPSRHLLALGLDELRVGDQQATGGRTITETDIALWCAVTGDRFQLHTNAEYASKSGYGAIVAPGLMVLAMTSGLGVPADSPSIIANYGMDRVRYVLPVFVGDTVRADIEVVGKRERDADTGIADVRWTNVNQHEQVVSVRNLLVLMRRKVAE